jgi:hypothetical protein
MPVRMPDTQAGGQVRACLTASSGVPPPPWPRVWASGASVRRPRQPSIRAIASVSTLRPRRIMDAGEVLHAPPALGRRRGRGAGRHGAADGALPRQPAPAYGWRSGPSSAGRRGRSPATSCPSRPPPAAQLLCAGSAMRGTASRRQDVDLALATSGQIALPGSPAMVPGIGNPCHQARQLTVTLRLPAIAQHGGRQSRLDHRRLDATEPSRLPPDSCGAPP